MHCNDSIWFSIIIPTKNRSEIIGTAVESVLNQDFKDLELIIVDNDDTDATYHALAKYIKRDKRLRYLKTGNLSMPDNWEFGLSKVSGKYYLILADKMTLNPNTLTKIYKEIKRSSPQIITWLNDSYNLVTGKRIPNYFTKGGRKRVSSDKVLRNFFKGNLPMFSRYAPLGYNSCIQSQKIKDIQNSNVGRVCLPISPDYIMAFQLLSRVSNYIHISEGLSTTTTGSLKYSNGESFYMKSEVASRFIADLQLDEYEFSNFVPVKTVSTINSLYNDFFKLAEKAGGKLQEYKLELPYYFASIYEENLYRRNKGVDVSKEMEAWLTSFNKQTLQIRILTYSILLNKKLVRIKNRIVNLPKTLGTSEGRQKIRNILNFK